MDNNDYMRPYEIKFFPTFLMILYSNLGKIFVSPFQP